MLATLLDTEALTTASGQPRILRQLMQLQGSAMDALFGFHKQLLRQRAPLLADHFDALMIEPQLYLVEVSLRMTCSRTLRVRGNIIGHARNNMYVNLSHACL